MAISDTEDMGNKTGDGSGRHAHMHDPTLADVPGDTPLDAPPVENTLLLGEPTHTSQGDAGLLPPDQPKTKKFGKARRPGIIIAAIVAFLLLLDFGFTLFAEVRASSEIRKYIGPNVSVDIHGWPTSFHLLRGKIPSVTMTATDIPFGDCKAHISRLVVDAHDLEIEDRSERQFSASSVNFRASMEGQELSNMAESFVIKELRLVEDEIHIVVGAFIARVSFGATIEARNNQLVLRATKTPVGILEGREYTMPSSYFPDGVNIENVKIDNNVMHMAGSFEIGSVNDDIEWENTCV